MTRHFGNELYHYGVKGMKWGVRKSRDNSKTTDNKHKRLTDKQKKILYTAAIVSTVTIGSAFVYNYMLENSNMTIPKGTNIQHMSRFVDELIDHPIYVSYLKKDNLEYAKNDLFGANWKTKMTLQSNKDLKIAGKRVAKKTYEEFKKTVPEAVSKYGNTSYLSFNRNLSTPDMNDKKIISKYYDLLKDKGYDAIHDLNDQWLSGTKAPLILFGSLGSIKVTDISEAVRKE